MAENTKDSTAEEPVPTPLGAAALPDSSQASTLGGKSRTFVTAGERIHHWSTYLGIDWIFNAISGVSFAYLTKYTEAGRKYWSGPITSFFDKTLKPFIKNDVQRATSAGYGNMFMGIIAGGMFTLPPLLALESKKVKASIVKFFDRRIYGKDKVENDPRFQDAYAAMESEPKKDFGSGMIARFAALAPLLAMVLNPTTKKISNKAWFDHVEKASDVTASKMGFGPHSFKNVSPAEGKERWKFIHESMAMDAGLGIPYAILHSMFYNLVVGMRGKKNGEEKLVNPIYKDAPPSTAVPVPIQERQDRKINHAERELKREAEATNAQETGAAR